MEEFEKTIKDNLRNRRDAVLNSFGQLEKAKKMPVGTINKYGEQKMSDGTWKYIKKKKGEKAVSGEKKTGNGVEKENIAALQLELKKQREILVVLNRDASSTKSRIEQNQRVLKNIDVLENKIKEILNKKERDQEVVGKDKDGKELRVGDRFDYEKRFANGRIAHTQGIVTGKDSLGNIKGKLEGTEIESSGFSSSTLTKLGKEKGSEVEQKVGDTFKSKGGNVYEILSFTKNSKIITYKVSYKDGRTETRQGSLSEITKFEKQLEEKKTLITNPDKIKVEKVTVKESLGRSLGGKVGEYKFVVNGVSVATYKIYYEAFSSIDSGGHPSKIRNKSKLARELSWDRDGVEKVTGIRYVSWSKTGEVDKEFEADYPDTKYGYAGSSHSAIEIKQKLQSFMKRKKID